VIAVIALAFALAMDAFAASIAEGCALQPTPRGALLLATVFGAAQALMPLIGLALGVAGGRIGARLGGHAEAAGGLVLIVLGMQILAEHLAA
jgi:putative Mn2+ efflux pump MntP